MIQTPVSKQELYVGLSFGAYLFCLLFAAISDASFVWSYACVLAGGLTSVTFTGLVLLRSRRRQITMKIVTLFLLLWMLLTLPPMVVGTLPPIVFVALMLAFANVFLALGWRHRIFGLEPVTARLLGALLFSALTIGSLGVIWTHVRENIMTPFLTLVSWVMVVMIAHYAVWKVMTKNGKSY